MRVCAISILKFSKIFCFHVQRYFKEKKRKKVAPKKEKVSRVFVPPSPQEVQSYCNERQNGINGDTFCDFYQSKDWMIGKNKMKDWKAAVRTWENDRKSKQQNQSQNGIQQRQNRNR